MLARDPKLRHSKNMKSIILLVILSCVATSCSHLKPKPEVELRLKALDQKLSTNYYSKSVSQQVKNRSFATEQESELRFTEIKSYLPEESGEERLAFQVEVKDKDGEAKMHEMAFPEPGEEVLMIYRPDATVVSAGDFSEDSVFYLPSLSLPEDPVRVGDTWHSFYEWVSGESGIPFSLELVTIFKEIKPCGDSSCALLEVSGATKMNHASIGDQFSSEVSGFILFDIDRGLTLSTDMKSQEEINMDKVLLRSSSCLMSRVESSKEDKVLECDPKDFAQL